jgi:hypothetical protein
LRLFTYKTTIILLILAGLAGIVQADSTHPPASIKICGYVTYDEEIGVWWINPTDADYLGVQIWFDDAYLGTVTPTPQGFYNYHTNITGNHTFSTHTVDTFTNVNATWENITVLLEDYPVMNEGWFCSEIEWCGLTPEGNFSVQAIVGETWIKYYWSTCYNVTVYIDGVEQDTNPSFRDYYLPNLNSNEKHKITLYNYTNSSELLGSVTATTLYPLPIIITLLSLLLILTIILFFISDPLKIILVSGFIITLALYTSQLAIGYGAFVIIPLVILIIAAIFTVYALWNLIIEKTRW